MSKLTSQANGDDQWASKARAQDSAERKEDYMVLVIAAVTVTLVMTNAIGSNFFKSLFF